MIAWLNAPALWGVAAALGAIAVHLLFRQRARRVPFPSLRFVQPSFTSAVRLRRPTDAALLALRVAVLVAAALALAQPLLTTGARVRAWDARVARAIVVDTSDSMRTLRAAAAETARAQEVGTVASVRIDSRDLGRGIQEAVTWLASAPPARREIAVVSDFQQGTLDASDRESVPDGIGLRFLQIGSLPDERTFAGVPLLDGDEGAVMVPRVRLDGGATSVEFRRGPDAGHGLEILGPAGSADAVRALRGIVAAAGAPAPPAAEAIALVLRGGTVPAPAQPVTRAWMLRSVWTMRENHELLAIGEPPPAEGADGTWIPVLRDRRGQALVRAAASGERLVIEVAAGPTDLLAAAALRAILLAAPRADGPVDQEILSVPHERLALWTREPRAPSQSADTWRHAGSDGRFAWALVLVMLAIEAVVRRQRSREREVRADAA